MRNIKGKNVNSHELKLFKQLELLVYKEKLYRNPSLNRSILAKHLSSNRTYVSGCVRHIAGKSLAEYIDALRLSELICRLRTEEEKCLFILAEEVGYPSYTTFYRSFVRRYGMPPAKYREQLNNL